MQFEKYVYGGDLMNTTEHRQGEEKLHESEKKYRQIVETLQEGICIIDKEGCTTFINPSMAEMFGYTVKEMQGKHLFSFMDKHGVDLAKQRLEQCKQGIKEQHEFEFIKKDGTKISTLIGTSTLTDRDGNYIGAFAEVRDITERKKEEEQIKNSEERYKNLLELAPDSIVTMDLKGYITSCNSAATRIFRYSKDELVGKHFSKIGFLHVKDIPKYLKVFVSVLRGNGIGTYELTVKDKDGTSRIAETHIGLIKENNKISGVIAITRDISEQKRTEENLKNSLERLIFAQKAAKTGFWDWDIKTGKQTWSEEFLELFGLPSDVQPTFDTWRKALHPDDRKRSEEKIYRSIEDKKSLDNEYRIILSDGVERWIRTQGDTFYDNSGNPQRMCGICIDITKQKQMGDGLRQIERELNKAQQIAHVGSWIWNIKNQNLTWTDELYRIYGVDKVFTLTFDNIMSMIHPEDREKNVAKVKEFLESATILEYEFRIIRPDNSIRYIFQSIEVSRDSTGKPLRAVGIMQDITERKKIEKEVIESEEKLKRILDSTPDAITVTDLNGNIVECNQATSKIYGSPKAEIIGKNALDFFSPKDRKKAKDNLKKTLELGSIKNVEYTLVTKDGWEYPAELSASLIRDMSGNPQSFVAILRDITERKRTEETLKESEEKLRSIVENSSDQIFMLDKDYKFLSINKTAAAISRKSPQEIIGRSIFEIFPETMVAQFSKNIKNVFDTGKSRFIDEKMVVQGHEFYNSSSLNPIKDDSGRVIAVTGIVRDITERKVAEEKIKRQNVQLKKLDGVKTDFLNTTSHELGTPVASIKGYVQMLLKQTLGEITEEQKKALEVTASEYKSIRSSHPRYP